MAFFSRLRKAKVANRLLGQGVWRRANDRFNRSLDRVFQILEGIADDQLHNRLMGFANELAELMPRVEQVCADAQKLTPSNDEFIPEPTFNVHRSLTKAANDLASTAQIFAMTKLQSEAGQDVSNFAVESRVRIVVEGIENAERSLRESTK